MTAYNIAKNLKKNGNAIVGCGYYSIVFNSKHKNKVIKLGTSAKDKWLLYHDYIKSNSSSCTPLVDAVYVDTDSNYYVATMEKLTEVSFDTTYYNATTDCASYISNPCKKRLSTKLAFLPAENLKDLYKTLDFIVELSSDSVFVDLHPGNFMKREDNLVIIDPFSDNLSHNLAEGAEDWVYTFFKE